VVPVAELAAPPSASTLRGIVASGDQTCVWSGSDHIACWGEAYAASWRESVPPQVVPVEDLVIAGRRRCARSGGRVACWNGELEASAMAPLTDAFTDLAISREGQAVCGARGDEVVCWRWDFPVSHRVPLAARSIVHTGSDFCALGSDARVHCWGFDGSTPIDCGEPVEIAGLEQPVAIAGPCALNRGGSVACWSALRCDAAADGPGARVFAEGAPITALAADGPHVCARAAGGEWKCQQVAGGGLRAVTEPVRSIQGVSPSATVVVGASHGCTLQPDGAVSCWGDNRYHQLGEPHNVLRLAAPTPLIRDARELGVLLQGGCVIRADERVWCWGLREDHQWGPPEAMPGVVGAHGLVANESHACVRRRGSAPMCWGAGLSPIEMPWADKVGRPIVHLRISGGDYGCAVYEDATADCAADDGGSRRRFRGVRDVAFCGSALCTVRADGAVSCVDLLLGTPVPSAIQHIDAESELRCDERLACAVHAGTTTGCRPRPNTAAAVEHPLLADGALRGSERAAHLSWYDRDVCVVMNDGAVACTNDDGVLTPVPAAQGAAQVEVGRSFVCIRHPDGVAACWGDNRHALSGIGSSAAQPRPVPVTPRSE